MEVIAVILFVILIIAGTSGKNRKKGGADEKPRTSAAKAPRQTPASESRAVRKARSVAPVSALARKFDEAMQTLDKQLEAVEPEARRQSEPVMQAMNRPAQGASMLDDADCTGGSIAHTHDEGHSTLEDEDCVGGSMEHTHTEGVSRAAQARRMAAMDAGQDGDMLPETIDARALRRAVVMAEVLGKPRALRRNI